MPVTANTEYTAPTLIVVKASLRAQAEQAARTADPEGGAGTFNPGTPLRAAGDATNTVVAYWARWNMKPSQRSTFASTICGPNNILAPGANVPLNRDRWFFDARDVDGWTGPQVLAALGYDTIGPPT